jgi:hypothetical protein
LFTLAQAAVQAVRAMCWLGILAALLAVPLVAHDRRWLLDSVHDTAAAAAHGNDLFLHFCLGLGAIVALLVLCLVFLGHLLRLLTSAARERPFTHANAQRLQRMAWLMLSMEVLSILIGGLCRLDGAGLHLDGGGRRHVDYRPGRGADAVRAGTRVRRGCGDAR